MVGLVVVAVLATVGLAPRLRGDSADGPGAAVVRSSSLGFAPVERRIEVLEGRVATGDGDYLNRTALAAAYLEALRVTGDPATLDRAEALLAEASANNPEHVPAIVLRASVDVGRHRFAEAHHRLTAAGGVDTADPALLALLVDVSLELGRITEAQDVLFRLGVLEGGTAPVLVRQAEVAWLTGDLEAAVADGARAIEVALAAGTGGVELALLQARHVEHLTAAGRLEDAEAVARAAVENHAGPGQLAALAEVVLRRGAVDEASQLLRRATDLAPTVGSLARHAEVLDLAGERAEAADAVAAAKAVGELAEAAGSPTERRAFAEVLALQPGEGSRAVELARAEAAARPGAETLASLGWVLHHTGRHDEAAEVTDRALAVGLRDPGVLARAALVAAVAGQPAVAEERAGEALAVERALDPVLRDAVRALVATESGR